MASTTQMCRRGAVIKLDNVEEAFVSLLAPNRRVLNCRCEPNATVVKTRAVGNHGIPGVVCGRPALHWGYNNLGLETRLLL